MEIIPINISTFEASIRATRTDDTDPDNPMVYDIHRAKIETPAQQLVVGQRIRAKHLAALATTAAIEAFVHDAEVAGKNYLEAQE